MTLEALKEKIKNDQEWQKYIDELGIVVEPTFKRMLVKVSGWTTKIVAESGLIQTLDYKPAKPEKERGERPSLELARCTIVAVAEDCDPKFIPGMDIAMMPQENLGYSTAIRFPNKKGEGMETYLVINEHEAFFIILEDRIKELSLKQQELLDANRKELALRYGDNHREDEHLDTGGDISMDGIAES